MDPAAITTPKIKTENLNFFYGGFHALKNINLNVHEMQVTALIGPSGCGKSTLIRLFNRMSDMTPKTRAEGKIMFEGGNIFDAKTDLVKLRRNIGMVFQKPNPFPKTIFQNISYGPEIQGCKDKDFIYHRVEESLKKAALWDDVKTRLHSSALGMSGGQQQRLCIARALAVEPKVILFDEPCASLDPISTAKIEELILELKKNYTILIVTHNMQQASRVSDYTAFMYLGNLIEFGQTDRVFTVPKDKKTEEYLSGVFG
ncbi:MAG: phosphate ABC transporter ATP-binding protein PstB [Elusimicrobiota bacterium]|nr:phosphate ABC transporter ATP-binding protein PstB [Elusimicrobiota bacterium]